MVAKEPARCHLLVRKSNTVVDNASTKLPAQSSSKFNILQSSTPGGLLHNIRHIFGIGESHHIIFSQDDVLIDLSDLLADVILFLKDYVHHTMSTPNSTVHRLAIVEVDLIVSAPASS
jgi:hypothetical protein